MEQSKATWSKTASQAILGAGFGAGGAVLALETGAVRHLSDLGGGALALGGVGLIYALMGLFVGLGALLPARLATELLNMADAEELAEQRAILIGSGVGCGVLGIGMMLLVMAAPGGPVPGGLALAAFVFGLVLTGAISAAQWSQFDELWQSVTIESGWIFALLIIPVLAVWGALAFIGQTAAPDPAALIALVMGLALLAAFIAVGRRGMLVQG